jgi:predicted ATP-dependent endonuclease of OLD family
MKISRLVISDIKSVERLDPIELSPSISVLLGPNNSGKSVLLNSLLDLQYDIVNSSMIRFGKQGATIRRIITDIDTESERELFGLGRQPINETEYITEFRGRENTKNRVRMQPGNPSRNAVNIIPANEPLNFIYPFLSKRKVTGYDQAVAQGKAEQVATTLKHLVSRVNRISNPNHPLFSDFSELCNDIIGFPLSTIVSPNGQQIGSYVNSTRGIVLEEMGEGVPNLLAMIVDLCMAENKLFIIEELENDIHPRALKRLLTLIIKKSETNQFVVSTHSNIVAKYLGSVSGSKLFRVEMTMQDRIPTTTVQEVGNDPVQRREVLEELGYEMTDYDLWDGWLILEESSAERIINDILIPVFTPELIGKIRTISAGGVENVVPKFVDFERLFLFTHLSPQYKNKAWVVVDNGDLGQKVVSSLKEDYGQAGWNNDRFVVLTENNIEKYYPKVFEEDVKKVLAMPHGKEKQQAKKELLEKVLSWTTENHEDAKKEFSATAKELLDLLASIKGKIITS